MYYDRVVFMLWTLASMSLCHFYYKTLKYSARQINYIQPFRPLAIEHDEIFLAIEEWHNTLKRLKRSWNVALLGCTLMVPCVAACLTDHRKQTDFSIHI